MAALLGRTQIRGVRLCLLLVCALTMASAVRSTATDGAKATWSGFSTSCTANDAKNLSVSCQGVRIMRRIVQQLLERTSKEPQIQLFEGVSLVEASGEGSSRKARVLKDFGSFGSVLQFLEGRELRIRLPSLLPETVDAAIKESMKNDSGAPRRGGGGGGGGGGGKKGGGGYMILALMMGKMMATLAMGALGAMTLKAMMVSSVALVMAVIVAAKKLVSSGDDGGGHHVVYAQEVGHHHRRKRSEAVEDLSNSPYRGYASIYGAARAS
ncbi:hypothetical protein KM043_006788 [Ampulex compressa]|nr:hypothetical protein KM043_006788 [Ampulex compressa]